MKNLQTLILKNISNSQQFFAPLNRNIPVRGTIDVLKMCDGNSDTAFRVVKHYRHQIKVWQIFEVFSGPLPSPESEFKNVAAPPVAECESDAVLGSSSAVRNPVRKFPKKKVESSKESELDPIA